MNATFYFNGNADGMLIQGTGPMTYQYQPKTAMPNMTPLNQNPFTDFANAANQLSAFDQTVAAYKISNSGQSLPVNSSTVLGNGLKITTTNYSNQSAGKQDINNVMKGQAFGQATPANNAAWPHLYAFNPNYSVSNGQGGMYLPQSQQSMYPNMMGQPQQGIMSQPQQQGMMGQPQPGMMGQQPQGMMGQQPQGMMGQQPQGMMGQQPQGMMGQQPQGMMGQQAQGMMGQQAQGMMGQQAQGMMGQQAQGMMGQQPQGMMGQQPQGMMGTPQGMMGVPTQGMVGHMPNMMGQQQTGMIGKQQPGMMGNPAMNGAQTGMYPGQGQMMGANTGMYNPQQMQQLQYQQMQQQMSSLKLGGNQMNTMPQQMPPSAGGWGASATGQTLSTNLWQ